MKGNKISSLADGTPIQSADFIPIVRTVAGVQTNLKARLGGRDLTIEDDTGLQLFFNSTNGYMGLLDSGGNQITLNGSLSAGGGIHINSVTGPMLLSSAGNGIQLDGVPIPRKMTPSSSATAGVTGQIVWDDNNIYVCTVGGDAGAATWKKAALSSV